MRFKRRTKRVNLRRKREIENSDRWEKVKKEEDKKEVVFKPSSTCPTWGPATDVEWQERKIVFLVIIKGPLSEILAIFRCFRTRRVSLLLPPAKQNWCWQQDVASRQSPKRGLALPCRDCRCNKSRTLWWRLALFQPPSWTRSHYMTDYMGRLIRSYIKFDSKTIYFFSICGGTFLWGNFPWSPRSLSSFSALKTPLRAYS